MNRIKELRKKENLNQTNLAHRIGVSQSALSYWERGDYEPDNDTLIKLADIFNVTIDYLLGRTDNPSPERDPTLDDFTYAMNNESKGLTKAEKEMLLDMAQILKAKRRELDKHGQVDKPV